jgi:hypothetical protein
LVALAAALDAALSAEGQADTTQDDDEQADDEYAENGPAPGVPGVLCGRNVHVVPLLRSGAIRYGTVPYLCPTVGASATIRNRLVS